MAAKSKKIISKKRGRPAKKTASAKARKKKVTSKKKSTSKKSSSKRYSSEKVQYYCRQPVVKERVFPDGFDPDRRDLIVINEKIWANGTRLHYYFFDQREDGENVTFSDGTSQWVSWVGAEEQRQIVRDAFDIWKDVGIGLEFEEVDSREAAEIRIGFMQGDGSWSYLGRDILSQPSNKRTMNFGWDLNRQPDTAIHEIGHTVGFPHEHQNPHAGIVWNEEAVYEELARTNRWTREQTFHNIIRKVRADSVQGSNWDVNSVMHYPFAPGLIVHPPEFGAQGIDPAPGLSDRDKTWIKSFYPPTPGSKYRSLEPFKSEELHLAESEQINFVIEPDVSRNYRIQTFGESDVVIVLFEDDNGDPRFLAGDDDSGEDRNSQLDVRLLAGRRYLLRIRLYWADASGRTAVMMW